MIMVRRTVRLVAFVASVLSMMLVAAPARVSATTGATHFLADSKYKVNDKVELLYTGTYSIAFVSSAARLRGGAMGIEINDRGYLYGVGQFYGYDDQGYQSTWTGTLYNFHQTKNGTMIFDVIPPAKGSKLLLARFFVTRATNGDLRGQIEVSGGRFAISWHKLPKH